MNSIIIIGNLTRDVDLDTTHNGLAVAKFTVAVRRKGAPDETDFIPVVVWRELAENCAKYTGKGSQVAVHGSLQIRHYETGDGTRRYAAEIIANEVKFLSRREDTEPDNKSKSEPKTQTEKVRNLQKVEQIELPF